VVPSLADESALLAELRELAREGRYRRLIERLQSVPEPVVEDHTPLALLAAEAHGRLGDHEAAERWAGRALDLARRQLDPQAELRATHVQGAIAWQRGNPEDAEAYFQRALEQARTLRDAAAQARAFNNLGILHDLHGATEMALTSYQLALASYQQAGDLRGMAETHHNMSISWGALGVPTRGRRAAEQAVRLALQVGDPTLLGLTLIGRAVADLALGDLPLAAAELERAAETYERVDFTAGVPEIHRVQGAVARARGDLAGAVRLLTQAAAASASAGAPIHTQAEIERDLGDALATQGDRAGARAARERGLALFRQLGARQAAEALESQLSAAK
jgi:tetratricopeptide (TPR) repeat protein